MLTKKQLFLFVTVFLLLLSFLLSAQPMWAKQGSGVSERSAGLADAASAEHPAVKIKFNSLKDEYTVSDPLVLYVTANKNVFLYLYLIDESTGEALLVVPKDGKTPNVYEKDKKYTIPGESGSIILEKSGVKRAVLLAATAYAGIDTAAYEQRNGKYFCAMEKAYADLEKIRSDVKTMDAYFDVVELTIDVAAPTAPISGREDNTRKIAKTSQKPIVKQQPAPPQTNTGPPIVFLSTDRREYKIKNPIRALFGADRDGYIFLYILDPMLKKTFLKKEAVQALMVNPITIWASEPVGIHRLIAVFSTSPAMDIEDTAIFPKESNSKGATLESPTKSDPPFAEMVFNITQ